MKLSHLLIAATILSGGIIFHPVLAAETSPTPATTTKEDVKKEVGEAVDTIKSYSIEKKDEAVTKAKQALDNFDARMEKWEQNAKEKKEKAVAQLKEKRRQVAERYEEMKRATKENWEKTKSRFLKDYQEMEEEYKEKVDPFLANNQSQ